MFTAWCLSTEGFEKMLAVGLDTPSFRCLCLGAWYQERGKKNWDVVRVGLFKLDDLWMDWGCERIFWGLWTWGSLKKLLMDKIQLTTKDDDYPIIYRVLTISGGDRRISEPSTGHRSFHGIPWLDPMNSVEITGQMRLKYRNNATVVVGCVFFRCAATCRRSLYPSWTCASCFMPLAISKFFFLAGWYWGAGSRYVFLLFLFANESYVWRVWGDFWNVWLCFFKNLSSDPSTRISKRDETNMSETSTGVIIKTSCMKSTRKLPRKHIFILVVVSNIFYFHLYLGKIPIWTNIFQGGWNHQPVIHGSKMAQIQN